MEQSLLTLVASNLDLNNKFSEVNRIKSELEATLSSQVNKQRKLQQELQTLQDQTHLDSQQKTQIQQNLSAEIETLKNSKQQYLVEYVYYRELFDLFFKAFQNTAKFMTTLKDL
jgi:heme oxygenase